MRLLYEHKIFPAIGVTIVDDNEIMLYNQYKGGHHFIPILIRTKY